MLTFFVIDVSIFVLLDALAQPTSRKIHHAQPKVGEACRGAKYHELFYDVNVMS